MCIFELGFWICDASTFDSVSRNRKLLDKLLAGITCLKQEFLRLAVGMRSPQSPPFCLHNVKLLSHYSL